MMKPQAIAKMMWVFNNFSLLSQQKNLYEVTLMAHIASVEILTFK